MSEYHRLGHDRLDAKHDAEEAHIANLSKASDLVYTYPDDLAAKILDQDADGELLICESGLIEMVCKFAHLLPRELKDELEAYALKIVEAERKANE